MRREGQSRCHGEIAAPLPVAKDVRRQPGRGKSVIRTERHLINPVARKFVALIKAGEAAVRRQIEGILRHHHAPAANGPRIVDRLGKNICAAQAETMA